MRGSEFQVVGVDRHRAGAVTILLASTGRQRTITRWEVERGYRLGLSAEQVTPTRLRQAGVSEANPTYVASILRAILPGIGTAVTQT